MNKLLLLFIILLLGLILCSFLGGYCYTEGFTTDINTITGVKSNTENVTLASSSPPSNSSSTKPPQNNSSSTKPPQNNSSSTKPPQSNSSSTKPPPTNASTSYDNYNHYNQTSYPTKYYGPNGTTATVINTSGTYTLAITETNGTTTIYNVENPSSKSPDDMSTVSKTTFYGQNGGTAKVATDNNGNYIVMVTQPDGTATVYTVTNTQNTIVPPPQQPTSQSSNYNPSQNYSNYEEDSGDEYEEYDNEPPSSCSGIPKGQEDLYILKSQIVPPVCPACPGCGNALTPPPVDPYASHPQQPPQETDSFTPSISPSTSSYSPLPPSSGNNSEKCPPCPACARCPEPSFECKKVPNYSSTGSSQFLPMPVVSDFSSFGM
jgi:hypothetical protein